MAEQPCEHIATATGAASKEDRRLCSREAKTIWIPDRYAGTVCLTCGATLPDPEEDA